MKLRTSCLRCTSGTSGAGSSLRKSLRREATVGTSCSRSRSTLSPLSHRCLSCLVLATEPQRRNKPLCCIPATRQTKTFSHQGSATNRGGRDDGLKILEGAREEGRESISSPVYRFYPGTSPCLAAPGVSRTTSAHPLSASPERRQTHTWGRVQALTPG